MRKCSLDKISSVFEEIAKSAKLYLPANESDGSAVYKGCKIAARGKGCITRLYIEARKPPEVR